MECSALSFDAETAQWSAACVLVAEDPVPAEWLRDGALIELLSGYRVLAVGRISGGYSLK